MTFDSEFNYTPAKNYLTDRINQLNSEITKLNDELAIIQNLGPSYDSLKPIRIDFIQRNVIYRQSSISKITSLISEIEYVENLDNNAKELLYNFWNTYKEPKRDWMRRMIYNVNISDLLAQITALNSDTEVSSEEKTLISKLILINNPIREETSSLLVSLKDN